MATTRRFRLTASALLAASGLALPALAQTPQGGQVAAGQATISHQGNFTGIRASNGAIINWQSFNIGQGQTVQFFQPNAQSRVLNRVTGPDPSRISGNLISNGIVYITNAAGVYFAHGSLVNVGGIYASAGNISNADFRAGRDHFTGVQGVVQNDGTINSPAAHLVGQRVANFGSINAPNGMVTMSAGSDVYIGEQGGQVFARISGPAASGGTGVTQAGAINAAGGQVRLGAGDMYAVAIDHPGNTVARQITLQGGRGGADPNVNGGIVSVTGTLDASDHSAGHTGGTVKVLGDRVGIEGFGYIDASGDAGGGTILVGGNRQGQGPETNAQATYVGVDATLRADATTSGSGGSVVVWSDNLTRAYGHISVHGADAGGFVETSGKHELQIMRTPDIQASRGRSGTWLIDPDDLTFAPAGTGNTGIITSGTTIFTSSGGGAVLDVGVLEAALTGGATVEVRTGASADPTGGTITLPSGVVIDYDGTGSNTLSLFAHRDIVLNGQILDSNIGTADSLNLNLTADLDANGTGSIFAHNVIDTGGGNFTVLSGVNFDNSGGAILTHGGNVTISLAGTSGVATLGADINANTGSVVINPDVVLGADLTLTGANVTLARRVDSDSTARDLTVSLTGAGLARFFGRIGFASALGDFTVNSAGSVGTTRLAGGSIAALGDITFSDDVQLQADTTISAANTTFAREIDSSGSARSLGITLTGPGLARFFGAIGSGSALSTLSVDSTTHAGATRLAVGSVTTTGAQTYGQDVVLIDDTTITAGGVTFSRRVDSDGTAHDLTVNTTGSTDTKFFGQVGSVSALDDFSTNADGSTFFNGTSLHAATVDFGDALLLGADVSVAGTTSVHFAGTLDSRSGQSHDILITSPSTTFGGAVGHTTAVRSLAVAAGGTTFIDAPSMSARFLDFGNAVVLNQTADLSAAVFCVFRSTVDSAAAGNNSLSITAPTINFNGRVGAAGADTKLGTLTTAGGTTTLNAGQLFADVFSFANAVVLANDTTLTAGTRVRFGAELDSRASQFNDLTINAPATLFAGVVGGGAGGSLGTLATDAAGTTTLSCGAMTVANAQFADAVLLGANCVLTATSSASFQQTVDSITGSSHDLTVNSSNTTFVGVVGGASDGSLGSLVTDDAGTTFLSSNVIASTVSFRDAVVLNGHVTVVASNSAEFGSTIDSASGQANNLDINSLVTTIHGAIGGTTGGALGTLQTDAPGTTTIDGAIIATSVIFNDTLLFGGGSISTTGDQLFNGALNLAGTGDTTLSGHNITFASSVDTDSSVSDRALIVNTDGGGVTTFSGPVGTILNPLASLTTNEDGTTILAGGTINTSGTQEYHDTVTLGANTTIGGHDITFFKTVDSDADLSPRSLTVNSSGGGTTVFTQQIGGTHALSSLVTNNDGTTRVASGSITASGTIGFNDAVILDNDLTLIGSAITFGGTLRSGVAEHSLNATTTNNGVTSFNGEVGGNGAALSSITTGTDGTTEFAAAAVRTNGDQIYHNAVVLAADCTMTGDNVRFGSTLDSTLLLSAAALTVNSLNSGTTTFTGAVGSSAPLSSLTTDASGVTRIGGNITTTGGTMTFNDTVRLFGNAVLTDTGGTGINFSSTVDSEGQARALSLVLNPDSNATNANPTIAHISFAADVGSAFALSSLSLGGDRTASPSAATIFAGINAGTPVSGFGLTINTTGDFTMGKGQKLSVLGDLTINAGGTARVGDISTLGAMNVNSSHIIIQTRPGGNNLFQVTGTGGSSTLVMGVDTAVDFVAGGAINFSSVPTISGSFATPSFATPGAQGISDTLRSFSQRDFGTVTADLFHSNALVLDLAASGPTNVNVANAIAGAMPDEEQVGKVFRDTAAGKAQQEALAEIGISTSSPDAQLLADILSGRAFYNDAAARDPWSDNYTVSINRLSSRAVARVLDSYRAVFVKDGQQQTAHVSQVLTAAWKEYSTAAGDKADALGFRAYCEAVPAQAQATYYLDGLRDLFGELGYLGLSPAELRHSKATILRAVAIPGLSPSQLEAAITATNMGVIVGMR